MDTAERLLILDRDGVINHDSDDFIKAPHEWTPIAGSIDAIAEANRKGYRVVVVSNQSGLARGLFDVCDLNAIHKRMLGEIGRGGGRIEAIFFCPHGPHDDCSCRKPRTGLLLDIASRLDTDLGTATFIGDRASDMAAAAAVGARGILVKTGHGGDATDTPPIADDVLVCDNLAAAVACLDPIAS